MAVAARSLSYFELRALAFGPHKKTGKRCQVVAAHPLRPSRIIPGYRVSV
jgi:hypothetical protein